MNLILIILSGLAGLIVLLLIIALFIKKDYSIVRTITISKPKQEVFDYIRLVKNQDHYNKWWMVDPDVKKEYRGTDGTVGFVASWESNNKQVGQGEQEIKKISGGERIDWEIRFKKPFEGISQTAMTTEQAASQTRVTWVFKGRNKYPMNLMNLVMNGLLGKDIDTSLQSLKSVLEK